MGGAPEPYILGISAFYHDSAAALTQGGRIVAAAQEERFTRKKHDESFPSHAVRWCLRRAGIGPESLAAVVFYDKPLTKFARLLETFLSVAPGGWRPFVHFLPGWLSEKLDLRKTIRRRLPELPADCPILFTQHHQAHAASAFYPSPFEEAAVLTVDGVGEWATTTIGIGKGNELRLLKEIRFPHSLGLLYSAFTGYCGFRVNSGEYKLMGLAPYGRPRFVNRILDELIDLKTDGSFRLNLRPFNFLRGATMTNAAFDRLFGGPPRKPEGPMEERFMDLARSIQVVCEEAVLRLARHAREVTGLSRLCLAGGVALNCVANGRLHRERIFERLWIQPAAGDAGGALGAALAAWHLRFGGGRAGMKDLNRDRMRGALLGPAFRDEEIEAALRSEGARFRRLEKEALMEEAVSLLAEGKALGWFQGPMEFGPRALGNRSILADPRRPEMQARLNLKVKFRESFRPFAPAILREDLEEHFDLDVDSPYMLLVAPIRKSRRLPAPERARGLELLRAVRSHLPAVTHVDYSARIQTVRREDNPLFYELLRCWKARTGCPVLVNTSFNVRGEPIVCSPTDAYRCFVRTHMDAMAIGSYLLLRAEQPVPLPTAPPDLPPD